MRERRYLYLALIFSLVTMLFALTVAVSAETVGGLVDLTITKSVTPSNPNPGDPITYTLTFSNIGTDPASGVAVTDIIPPGVNISNATSSGVGAGVNITATGMAPFLSFDVSNLDVGEGGIITLTGHVGTPAYGETVTNTAQIMADSDYSPGNNSSSVAFTVPALMVDTLEDEVADNGATSLREAIALAQNGDAIAFDDSLGFGGCGKCTAATRGRGATIELSPTLGALILDKDLTIVGTLANHYDRSVGGPGNIAVSGVMSTNVIVVDGANVSLDMISVMDGYSDGAGGAGIAVINGGDLQLSNSFVGWNLLESAEIGAGLHIDGSGSATVYSSTFGFNTADGGTSASGGGGAIGVDFDLVRSAPPAPGGSLTVYDSTFYYNSASGSAGIDSGAAGGAIVVNGGQADILSSTFIGNVADDAARGGGAIAVNDGAATAINSTFYANSAANNMGGAIRNDGDMTLVSSTLSDNVTGLSLGTVTNLGTMSIDNTIIANTDTGDDCANFSLIGATMSGVTNLIEDNGGGPLVCAIDIVSTDDPQLGPLAFNGGGTQTMAIALTSPALNAGTNAECLPFDQRGFERPVGRCDIGAVEIDLIPELSISKDISPTIVESESDIEYTIVVNNSEFFTATDVTVRDQLPDGLELNFASGYCDNDYQNDEVECVISELGAGEAYTLYVYAYVFTDTEGAVITNTATVTSLKVTEPLSDNVVVTVDNPCIPLAFPRSVGTAEELDTAIRCFNEVTDDESYTINLTDNITIGTRRRDAPTNNNETVALGRSDTLRPIINYSNAGLIIEGNGYELMSEYGGGCCIPRGGGGTRGFLIEAVSYMEIYELEMNNFHYYGNGAAINNQSFGTLYIESSQFGGNSVDDAPDGGGAIFSRGPVFVYDSEFFGNRAENAGMYSFDGMGGGGAIYAMDYLDVYSSTFGFNSADFATHGGGAIYAAGELYVDESNFFGNSAYGYDDESCRGCRAGERLMGDGGPPPPPPPPPFGEIADTLGGGAIFAGGYAEIDDSWFEYNDASWAREGGGAIYALDYLEIDDTDFYTNHADFAGFTDPDGGGAIPIGSGGGAIYATGDTDVDESNFMGNTANMAVSGGGAVYARDYFKVDDSTFSNNTAYAAGTDYFDIRIPPPDGAGGGALYLYDEAYIEDSNFDYNSANDSLSGGGAIYSTDYLYVEYSHFDDNSAEYVGGSLVGSGGGAIYATDSLYIDYAYFDDNSADFSANGGGAIYAIGMTEIDDSEFEDNHADGTGGGVIWAGSGGGAIYTRGFTEIDDTIFDNNQANAFFCCGKPRPGPENDEPAGGCCRGGDGGGGAIYTLASLDIDEVAFVHNDARNYDFGGGGGAIYVNQELSLVYVEIDDSYFFNNDGSYGGAIYNDNAYVEIRDGLVENNMAQFSGGGLYGRTSEVRSLDGAGNANRATFYIDQTSIINNVAANERGGGLYIREGSVAHVMNSTISGNSAGTSAGYYDLIAGDLCCFDGQGNGGGIYVGANGNGLANELTLEHVTVTDNYAMGFGGGIDFNRPSGDGGKGPFGAPAGDIITLRNSIVAGNQADGITGGIPRGDDLTYNDCYDNETRDYTLNVDATNIFGGEPGDSCQAGASDFSLYDEGLVIEDVLEGLAYNDGQFAGVGGYDGPELLGGGPSYGDIAPTHALVEGSIARDNASEEFCDDEDQREYDRPQGAACDIGAFEASPPVDLDIDKYVDDEYPVYGQTITWTIEVYNDGYMTATNVTVTDVLSDALELVATNGCAEDPMGVPVCSLGDIDPFSYVSFTISTIVSTTAQDVYVYNTATVTSTEVTWDVYDYAHIYIGNAPPEPEDDSYVMVEGNALTVDAEDGLLANDSDPNDDELSLNPTGIFATDNGTIVLDGDGSFVYIPDAGFAGTDSYTYTVSDGDLTAEAVVTIDVTPFTANIVLPDDGWHLFGYPLHETQAISPALQSIDGKYTNLWGYDAEADAWIGYVAGAPSFFNDLHVLEYGKGYWIQVTEPVTIVFSTANGRTVPATVTSTIGRNTLTSIPTPPSAFYGTVTGAGAGSVIRAYIDGVQCGEAVTQMFNGAVVYSLHVASASQTPLCGTTGDTIALTLDDTPLAQTATWDRDVVQVLDIDTTQIPTAVTLSNMATAPQRTLLFAAIFLTLVTCALLPVPARRKDR